MNHIAQMEPFVKATFSLECRECGWQGNVTADTPYEAACKFIEEGWHLMSEIIPNGETYPYCSECDE